MNGHEFLALRRYLGLSEHQCGLAMGLHGERQNIKRQIRKWEALGQRPLPSEAVQKAAEALRFTCSRLASFRYDMPSFDAAVHGDEALALWCSGRDTRDIASALGVPECSVANALPRLLERPAASAARRA